MWSRKILGWAVHAEESADHAAALVERIRLDAGDLDLRGWVLHSDNGATLLATLQRLGLVPSFSRPGVSDDNPFSEALFRTLKSCPRYPSASFASLAEARAWVAQFVDWYNTEHRHSSIGYVTPAARHAGDDLAILAARRAVYQRARRRHPARWAGDTRQWERPPTVTLNPETRRSADPIAA